MTLPRVWARDLGLGVQLAFRGARTRTALTAIGIALGVGVLLFAASLPGAIDAREARLDARSMWGSAPIVDSGNGYRNVEATDHTALVAEVTTIWNGERISGMLVRPDGTSPPLPPGLDRLPRPGEVVVSPALAKLLAAPDAALLRERLGNARVIGTIRPDGLNGPADRYWYGYSALDPTWLGGPVSMNRIDRFGSAGPRPPLDPAMRLIVLVGAIVLLFPIAILVGTAVRFGSERRDRRLAALRLVGTSRAETARIAAGESLAAALLGILGGAALFALARQTLGSVESYGYSLFPTDVQPDPLLSTLILGGVLLVSIGTTLFSMRRVAVEPLAVSRRGRVARRRLWWRPLPLILGSAVLAPLVQQGPEAPAEHPWQVGVGAVLSLVGVVALLPWVVDATVARLRGWSVSSQLAVRTLQTDGAGASRIVSGVAVAVAGAITLQMLLSVAVRQDAESASRSTADASVYLTAPQQATGALKDRLRATPGVASAVLVAEQELRGHGAMNGMSPELIVGDCASLAAFAAVQDCDDEQGSMFRVTAPRGVSPNVNGEETVVPAAGESVKARPYWSERWQRFSVPADVPTVRAKVDVDGVRRLGLYATPSALPPSAFPIADLKGEVQLDPDDPLALERLRTAVARISPLGDVYEAAAVSDAVTTSAVRRVLMAGATLLLMLIAASLLVTTLEQLGERRRSLATLAAFGTPRATLRRSLWWQTAVPVAIGLGLAVTIGTALGTALLRLQDQPVTVDLFGTAQLLALAVGLVAVVTLVSLPLLGRVARPSALRVE